MADKSSIIDLLSLGVDLLTLGRVGKREGDAKQVISPEALEAMKKVIVPKIFGAGPTDEGLFAAALAKLADGRQLKISRFLDRLTPYDKKQFRLAIAILPDEGDRIQVLNMYSELSDEEMEQVAKATGMISGGIGPIAKMTDKAKKVAIGIATYAVEKLDPKAKEWAKKHCKEREGRVKKSSFARRAMKTIK